MTTAERSVNVLIRLVQESDLLEWLRLRRALWLDDSLAGHNGEMNIMKPAGACTTAKT